MSVSGRRFCSRGVGRRGDTSNTIDVEEQIFIIQLKSISVQEFELPEGVESKLTIDHIECGVSFFLL